MDEKFSWGWVIFIVLILWFFLGNNGYGYGRGYGCGDVSNCAVERQGLITAAETNYRIIDENRRSTDLIMAQSRAQWDAQQAETIFDLKINNLAQQNAYNLALLEKNSTIERMTLANGLNDRFNQIDAKLAALDCKVLKQPPVYGIATSCNPIVTPFSFGYNACNTCGTGTLV